MCPLNRGRFTAGLPPLKNLVDSFIELGGTLLICSPCIQERQISPDTLVETAQPIKAARVVMELLEASATLSY